MKQNENTQTVTYFPRNSQRVHQTLVPNGSLKSAHRNQNLRHTPSLSSCISEKDVYAPPKVGRSSPIGPPSDDKRNTRSHRFVQYSRILLLLKRTCRETTVLANYEMSRACLDTSSFRMIDSLE